MDSGTVFNNYSQVTIETGSSNRTYPAIPMFVILWSPWKHEDDYDDRVRIWGIYVDESESKRIYEALIKLKTGLSERGSFTWLRCENFNCGPNDLDKTIEFEIEDGELSI